MQEILAGLEGVECQTNDILMFGDSYEQHGQRLETVFRRLEENGVTLNLEVRVCQGESCVSVSRNRKRWDGGRLLES